VQAKKTIGNKSYFQLSNFPIIVRWDTCFTEFFIRASNDTLFRLSENDTSEFIFFKFNLPDQKFDTTAEVGRDFGFQAYCNQVFSINVENEIESLGYSNVKQVKLNTILWDADQMTIRFARDIGPIYILIYHSRHGQELYHLIKYKLMNSIVMN
jgi:hypothetical protein